MRRVRLFVYGSLKRGGRHHAELQGAEFLGEAHTPPGYTLVELGEYLALEQSGSEAAPVRGELFEVSEAGLPALDAFEGDDYERRALCVTLLGRSGSAASPVDSAESAEKCLALAYLRRAR